ncbi:MAG: YutD family protein [Streptococcaceae bacterium]|jgi:uncharacterized protein YutD|nr:YutD family protein [Streptococcaceae bacterium]
MAKEISEELKNYNKYPGEQVMMLSEGLIKVGEKSFRLVKDFKGAFEALAFEQRYGHVFDKFDYVVGDWGHELLRLRGFYENTHKNVEADEKIDHLADYLQEYCAFGARYFVLQRARAEGEVDAPFVADKADLQTLKVKNSRNTQARNRGGRDDKNRHNRDSDYASGFSTVRPDGKPTNTSSKAVTKANIGRKNNKNDIKFEAKPENKQRSKSNRKVSPQKSEKKFTIRERKG